MASESDKKWNRPWNMEEIIENAENWSLAGDVALLNSIKAYADNLLAKTLSISNNVDDLLNGLNEVGLKLEISHNEFQSLRNTQFIESRVYEDDETLDIKEEFNKEEEKILNEEEKQQMIREAALEGLKVMDKYFDKIEVSISDSEEETERSYILQPKDLYVDRPLPLVIGTEDWYKKWHAGLAESSSEEESDEAPETYSDSDSDDHLPKDLLKGSETSSELDLSSQTSDNRPVANSTFNESAKQPDIFESDESEEQGSLPVKAPISNKNFAEQLAERLGNVISEREDIPAEINKRPIQPAKQNQFIGNLFSDEPPPLDDLDDTILPKSAQSGLFSGGRGLFDDNEDELFWGQQNKATKISVEEKRAENKQDMPPAGNKNVSSLPKVSQVSKGLFDSDNSSDDDLFAYNRKQTSKRPFLQPFNTVPPLFDEEPPELDTQKKTPEQPSGKKVENTPQSVVEQIATKQESVKPQKNIFDDDTSETLGGTSAPKRINLFDDDDDLFKDDLFSDLTSKKAASKLFGAEESEEVPKLHLFNDSDSKKGNKEVKVDQAGLNKPKKVISLFSDDEEEESENQSNVSKTIDDRVVGDVTRNKDADFNEISEVSTKQAEVEEKPGDNITNEVLSERQVIGAETKPVEKKTTKGLFDNDDDTEDLFKGAGRVPSPPRESIMEPPQLHVTVPTPQARKVEGISLFGSTPPPDDDDWDTKSDNFSDTEDLFSYRTEGNLAASSLFDNEPPSLEPDESSGIVRDENITRVDTDDSSFYPYASSSRRLSSDIFSEQQSQDNLFVTKSKTESISIIPPPLDIIPEDTKVSHVDITPSGNPSDLEDTTGESLTADSVFEEIGPGKPKKPVSLFDDDDYEGTEDFFSSKVEDKGLPKLSDQRQSLFGDIMSNNSNLTANSEVMKNQNEDNNVNPKRETTDKEETKSSPEKSKIANLIDQIQSESVKEQPSPSSGSPRKLKHNLNINVSALLPGYAPPKLRELPKSHSLDLPKERDDPPSDSSTPDSAFFTPQTTSHKGQESGTSSEKAVSFEDAFDNVEVLHSITKDRAKIPIKRRPSTRRGRREAITKSAADLSVTSDKIIKPDEEKPKGGDGTKKYEPKVVEVESSEKEEFHEPLSKTKENFIPEDPGIQKPIVRDIFEGDGDSDEGLFPKLPAKTAREPQRENKATIFDSEDSDGDIFGPRGNKKSKNQRKQSESAVTSKKSLFNDSSSDDDLFATSNRSDKRKKEQSRPAGKKTKASATLRKLENIQTDDDPLSSLLK